MIRAKVNMRLESEGQKTILICSGLKLDTKRPIDRMRRALRGAGWATLTKLEMPRQFFLVLQDCKTGLEVYRTNVHDFIVQTRQRKILGRLLDTSSGQLFEDGPADQAPEQP